MQSPSFSAHGARAALLAPASPFGDPALLVQSEEALRNLGYTPVVYPSARSSSGYLAASDAERAADLMDAFCDESIRAIFCIRGGYGCMRILPLLDYERIAAHKKPLIGLSDITALHLALYKKAGLSGLHAPMPFRYPALPQSAGQRLTDLLSGKFSCEYTAEHGLFCIHSGRVRAPMIGGNLTLVASLVNSDYFPDLSGHILFLEEIGEEPYRIDRLLTALALSHVFERVRGVVFGGFTDCGDEKKIRAILSDCIPAHIPTLGGFPAGHMQNNHAFSEGQTVTIDPEKNTLVFHEKSEAD